jgi:nicotinate-nucleotide pyrophosphorylase (carboxylating)
MSNLNTLQHAIETTVRWSLQEDMGEGDVTAALIPAKQQCRARVITREDAVICGRAWVDEVFRQLDPGVEVSWCVQDGDRVTADTVLFRLQGKTRSLLTGERCALNFLQTLSGTATSAQQLAARVEGTGVRLLDTRKTLPGLRAAQKYAVTQGGCYNHRMGLYDAYLIKENHIAACGGIAGAVHTARSHHPDKPVEVEVENLEELQAALDAGADTIMLDNFSLADMRQGVTLTAGKAKLEASGGITADTLRPIAETGVDFISIGALTKDCRAIDLSMRIINN